MKNWNLYIYFRLAILSMLLVPWGMGEASWTMPLQSDKLVALQFPPTGKNRGTPQRTAGGGTRSDDVSCLIEEEQDLPLVALMPDRENESRTSIATPSLYWYVPQTTASKGEFVLVDENNQEAYYAAFDLPKQPGIIKLRIPEAASLEPGKIYSWSMMVICDSRYRNRDKYVEGKIEYVTPDDEINRQVSVSPALEQAKIYANSNLWLETLDTIVKIRPENPDAWQELLQSVGLESLSDKNFVDCCSTAE